MKKNGLYSIFTGLLLILALQSCNTDDGYFPDTSTILMATVQKEVGTPYPYFKLDNGKTMWVSIPEVPFTDLIPGQRVIGDFTIVEYNRDSFDYFVRLNNYSKVLTKQVINLTEYNRDSIGNSEILINSIWVGSYYLNVTFQINIPSIQKHLVNLVVNRLVAPEDDGYAHLEFRYNNQGDQAGSLVPGLVSFDLGGYGPSNTAYKGIKVKVNTIGDGEKDLIFNYSDTSGNEKELSYSDITDAQNIE